VAHEVIPHVAWRKGRYAIARYIQVWRLSRVMRAVRPDIVHCNEYHSLPQGLRAAKLASWRGNSNPAPVVVHVRLGMPRKDVCHYGLWHASKIITVSRAVASLFDWAPALRERVRVVYNGVDLSSFHPADSEARQRFRAEFGLEDRHFAIGLAGLLSERKRQHIAIEAMARLRDSRPEARLLLAGEAFGSSEEYAKRLRLMARERNIEDRIVFLGHRDPIQPVYAALDANLLISSEEGFGRTIIESGAMGVPSVGTRIGGIPELIEDGQTGRLMDLDDVEALCGILCDWISGRGRVRAMGDAARALMTARFSIEAHVRAIESVWEEALRGRGGGKD